MNKHQSEKRRRNKSRPGVVLAPLGRILRRKNVRRVTGLSDTTIWRLEKAGKFPRRLQLTANTVGWSEREVRDWIESRKPVDDAA